MSDETSPKVPVWALTTRPPTALPTLAIGESLSAERLDDLRSALAAMSEAPVVTLEQHPLVARSRPTAGIPLDSLSPLARELSELIKPAAGKPAVQGVAQSGEVLYRMVVPAKVASQFTQGLVKPMRSRVADGAMYGDLVGKAGNVVAAKASFIPVPAATAGATGGAVGATAGTVAAGTALTVAAPLVLMAVAVSVSAYAERERQRAIEKITDLLEQFHDDRLDDERNELDGCRDAIDKATGLLLDRGRIGASLGLDSAVHEISSATRSAERRVAKWESALSSLADDRVDVADIEKAFPGITSDGGTFRTQVELATLAIALKRRVVILQAVEAAQDDPDNGFDSFLQTLTDDQRRIDDLQERVDAVLQQISVLRVRSPKRLRGKVMTRQQVDDLLDVIERLQSLGSEIGSRSPTTDVTIEIEQHSDGKLLVLPAQAV